MHLSGTRKGTANDGQVEIAATAAEWRIASDAWACTESCRKSPISISTRRVGTDSAQQFAFDLRVVITLRRRFAKIPGVPAALDEVDKQDDLGTAGGSHSTVFEVSLSKSWWNQQALEVPREALTVGMVMQWRSSARKKAPRGETTALGVWSRCNEIQSRYVSVRQRSFVMSPARSDSG